MNNIVNWKAHVVTPTISPVPSFAPTMALIRIANLRTDKCAEDLPYGPTELGEFIDPTTSYFSTSAANVLHKEWTITVWYSSTFKFAEYTYSFHEAKTLRQRFVDAVSTGELVDITHTSYNGATTTDTYINMRWWFSSAAGNMGARFDATTDGTSFSDNGGTYGTYTTSGLDINGGGSRDGGYEGIGIFNGRGDSDCIRSYDSSSGGYFIMDSTGFTEIIMLPLASDTTDYPTAVPIANPTAFPTVTAPIATTAPTTAPTTASTISDPTADPTADPTMAEACPGPFLGYDSCEGKITYAIDNRPDRKSVV
jgi:hypothetical protein